MLILAGLFEVSAVKDDRYAKIEEGFRKAYARFVKEKNPPIVTDKDIDDEETFKNLIRDRTAFLINDGRAIFVLITPAYQLYNKFLYVIKKNGRSIIAGDPEPSEIKYWLTRFELDELLKKLFRKK